MRSDGSAGLYRHGVPRARYMCMGEVNASIKVSANLVDSRQTFPQPLWTAQKLVMQWPFGLAERYYFHHYLLSLPLVPVRLLLLLLHVSTTRRTTASPLRLHLGSSSGPQPLRFHLNQMELKQLYHVFSHDGKRLLFCKVYGSRVRFWQDQYRASLTPYDECCRQVAAEASNANSKNVQTSNILDIVYYEDHPSLPPCASIAAPRPQNI